MSQKKREYKLHQYSKSDLEKAVEKCRKGESFRKVSAEFNIPKSTLFAKIQETVPLHAKRGPKTILLEEEENRLQIWILGKARLGFLMHADEVKIAVKKVLDDAKRQSTFIDNRPGDKWLQLFLKRHPEINKKQTELISKSRASVIEEKLREWFSEVKKYLEENNLSSVLERPESIFNGDETGVQLCPKSGRLLGPRSERNFYEISTGQEKETVTVLCTFSAAGASLPPMVMFPYKRIPAHLTQSVPADWSIGRSETGWMVSSTFFEYMANVFYLWCVKQNVKFPVIYFLDGHKSHLSLELSDFCLENNIILVSLFPNATHIIQPCDVAVFRAVKYKWREVVQQYKQETQVSLTKATFAPLFKKAFDQINRDTIKNGFRKCGLYPFDANAVDYDRCISTRRQQLKNNTEESTVFLNHSDFASTKKFFDCFIDKQKINEFIEIRRSNQSFDNEVYLLWKTCMDKLELDELEESQCEKDNQTSSENLSQYVMQDVSASTTDEMSLFVLGAEDNIEVVTAHDDQRLIDILSIPIVDISTISNLEDISIIADSSPKDIQSSDMKVIGSDSIKESLSQVDLMDTYDTHAEESIASTTNKTRVMHEAKRDCLHVSSPKSNDAKEFILLENKNKDACDINFLQKNKENLTVQTSSKKTLLDPWDKHLLWPSTGAAKDKPKKEVEKLPCVLTCSQWRENQLKKKQEKEKKELETQERILKRKIKKEETEKKKRKLKEEREAKKIEKEKFKEEKIKIKKEKAERTTSNAISLKRKPNVKLNTITRRSPLSSISDNIKDAIDLSLPKIHINKT